MLSAVSHTTPLQNIRKPKKTDGTNQSCNEATIDQSLSSPGSMPCASVHLMVRLINQMLASGAKVSANKLLGPVRGDAKSSRARQVAIYLMHTSLSLSYGDISRIYGRDRTTIAYSCKVVEDLRDEPLFDGWITGLEQAVSMMLSLSAPVSWRKDTNNA